MGRSDHICLKIELKVQNDIEFLSTRKQNWYKVDTEFVKTHSKNIDWGYSSDQLDVEGMWGELHSKLLSICDSVPVQTLKTTREGEVIERLPWDCSMLSRKRKSKDRSWRDFESSPSLVTYNTAMFEQQHSAGIASVTGNIQFQ